ASRPEQNTPVRQEDQPMPGQQSLWRPSRESCPPHLPAYCETSRFMPDLPVHKIRIAQNNSQHFVRNVGWLIVIHHSQRPLGATWLACQYFQPLQHPVDIQTDEHHCGLLEAFGSLVNLAQVQRREVENRRLLRNRAAV